MNKEEIKESEKKGPLLNRVNFKSDLFKVKGSNREQLTETVVTETVWLMENGEKIFRLANTTDVNFKKELIAEGNATNFNTQQKLFARKYVADTILTSHDEGKMEAYGSKELWQDMIFNAIKDQPIVFIGEILVDLRRQFFPWCSDLAEEMLKKLEDSLVAKYEKETPENKDEFKNNLKKKFLNAKIIDRLK